MSTDDKRIRITVVGDGAVGKTCLLIAYKDKMFKDDYIPTVFDEYSMNIDINRETYRLILSDTAGQEEYDKLRPLAYTNTNIFIICFSVRSKSSFRNVFNKWNPEVRHYRPNATIILVGNMVDLRESSGSRSVISSKEGEELKERIKADAYVECSAKCLWNVDKVFQMALIKHIEIRQRTRKRPTCRLL